MSLMSLRFSSDSKSTASVSAPRKSQPRRSEEEIAKHAHRNREPPSASARDSSSRSIGRSPCSRARTAQSPRHISRARAGLRPRRGASARRDRLRTSAPRSAGMGWCSRTADSVRDRRETVEETKGVSFPATETETETEKTPSAHSRNSRPRTLLVLDLVDGPTSAS